MEITTDLLRTIRNRVDQYCLAKYNAEPCDITIDDDGIIHVDIGDYFRGEWDGQSYEISAEDLTTDLDVLIKVRIQKERMEQELRREKEIAQRIQKEEEAKRNRYAKYLQLKKEFES